METLRHDSLDELAQSKPLKPGAPPKRPSNNAQRTSYSTPSATTKQTTSSASQSKRGSALSKPPARPPPKSESRVHRQRNSISSVDSFTKGEPSASDDGKPSSGRRLVKTGVASKARRSTLGPGSNPKMPPVRDGTKSPSKPASRPSLSGAASLADRTALRSGRQQASSAKSVPSSLASAKKRLSTIPDSPLPARTTPQEALSQAKATRPGLGTRKSMTSVTIEQRLREMEAVHSMLRVAMADDGNEDDEAKEEYGKKVDETLANLRAKLEDARRSEGKIDSESTENASDDPFIATSDPKDQIDRTPRNDFPNHDQAKDRELSQQREVIESLRKEVLQLHESKDQELESAKNDLSQAHEAIVLRLRQLLNEQQGNNELQLRDFRATVASLDETNAELNRHQTTIEKQAEKSQSDLAELQSKYNTLLEEAESAAKHHFDDIGTLKSEKAHLITSKDLELEGIKVSYIRELDALKESIRFQESQSRSDQETRKKLEEDIASVQQRQETECRLMREQCDAVISQKVQDAENLCEQAEKSIQKLKSQLNAAEGGIQTLKSQLEVAEESIQKLKSQLEVAEEAAKLNKKKYEQSTFELESACTKMQEVQSEAKVEAENLSIRLAEQTEAQQALRDNVKAQLDSNSELTAQLQDSQATAKRLANDLCETESALKVATAELVEIREKTSNGDSPLAKNRTTQLDHSDGIGKHVVSKELGSQTQAHMAGLQEQIRQMDRLNEEILEEQQSFYLKLVKAEKLPSLVPRSSSSSNDTTSHASDESDESEL